MKNYKSIKKTILVAFSILLYFSSNAQDTKPVRLNFVFGYELGFQYFNLHYLNRLNNSLFLEENMPPGAFYVKNNFAPTVMHSFHVSTTILKNKTYWFSLGLSLSKNESHSYAYTADPWGNPIKRTSSTWFNAGSFNYGLKKEITLKKYGSIIPGISFTQYYKLDGHIDAYDVTIDKTDGSIINEAAVGKNALPIGASTGNWLMLFNNPRLGVEYRKNVFKGIHLGITYAYQFSGQLEYLYKNATTWDLSGQNISLSLSYKLFNK